MSVTFNVCDNKINMQREKSAQNICSFSRILQGEHKVFPWI